MFKLSSSTWLLAVIIYVLYILLMPPGGMSYDMYCWAQWADYIFKHGLGNAYDSGTNYLPGHLYELKLYTLFCHSSKEVSEHIYYVKSFTLFFDVSGALLVSSLVVRKSMQKMVLLILMLNPAYVYNSLAWGQFDSVFSCLAFASFLFACRKKLLLSSCLYLLSLNFKFQAIIFLPAMILFFIHQSAALSINWRLIIKGAVLLAVMQFIILIPFIKTGSVHNVWETAKSYNGFYNYVSLNAANVWQLFLSGDLRWMSENITFNGMSYKQWGLIMFACVLFITLMPFLKNIYSKFKKKETSIQLPQLLLIFTLSPLVFFFFNTEMHERYSYPTFLFIAAYALLTSRWYLYLIFSVAYFMNADKVLRVLTVMNYDGYAFKLENIALIFLILIVLLFVLLFFNPDKHTTAKAVSPVDLSE